MIKLWIAATLLGPVYRQSADHYSIPGYGVVETNACTVSANGNLTTRVSRDWIFFYDRDGNLEADCQRLNKPRPIVVNEKLTIHRGIATVEK
jgi:hypothetical protein